MQVCLPQNNEPLFSMEPKQYKKCVNVYIMCIQYLCECQPWTEWNERSCQGPWLNDSQTQIHLVILEATVLFTCCQRHTTIHRQCTVSQALNPCCCIAQHANLNARYATVLEQCFTTGLFSWWWLLDMKQELTAWKLENQSCRLTG